MCRRKFNITIDGMLHAVEVEEIKSSKDFRGTENNASKFPESTPKPEQAAAPVSKTSGNIAAPLQGTISQVAVSVGQRVVAGDILAIIEAMKMENEILAPTGGTVDCISVKKGDIVAAGDLLMTLR